MLGKEVDFRIWFSITLALKVTVVLSVSLGFKRIHRLLFSLGDASAAQVHLGPGLWGAGAYGSIDTSPLGGRRGGCSRVNHCH